MNLPINNNGDGAIDVSVPHPHLLQQYQFIYTQLTSRAEKRNIFKSRPHKISTDDILHLHHVIDQTIHTMDVVNTSVYITQRSVDKSSERWSGFEKFRLQSGTIPQVTAEIEIVYNFLIKLPAVEQPSPYKVTIGLRNSLYEMEKFRRQTKDMDAVEIMMMSQMATAKWEIEFVDTSVARTIGGAIDGWYENLREFEYNKTEKFAKSLKPYVNTIVRTVSLIIVAVSIFGFKLFDLSGIDLYKIIYLIISIYLVHIVTTPLISILHRKMMCIQMSSALIVTAKDRELVDTYEKNRGRFVKFLWFQTLIPQLPASLVYLSNKIMKLFS